MPNCVGRNMAPRWQVKRTTILDKLKKRQIKPECLILSVIMVMWYFCEWKVWVQILL